MEKKKETAAAAETGGIFFSSTFDLNHRWVTLTPTTAVQMNGAPIMLQTVQGKLVRLSKDESLPKCELVQFGKYTRKDIISFGKHQFDNVDVSFKRLALKCMSFLRRTINSHDCVFAQSANIFLSPQLFKAINSSNRSFLQIINDFQFNVNLRVEASMREWNQLDVVKKMLIISGAAGEGESHYKFISIPRVSPKPATFDYNQLGLRSPR